jgi:hypothetical protein
MKDSDSEHGDDPWWNAVQELADRVLKEVISFTHDFPAEPNERSILIRQALVCVDGMLTERLAEGPNSVS